MQAILAARIDRLPPDEKELLQTLAVIGKEFPLGLVTCVTGKAGRRTEPDAAPAARASYLRAARGRRIEYTFKHALTQEVAYNSVLTERRRLLHERIGAGDRGAVFASQLDDH